MDKTLYVYKLHCKCSTRNYLVIIPNRRRLLVTSQKVKVIKTTPRHTYRPARVGNPSTGAGAFEQNNKTSRLVQNVNGTSSPTQGSFLEGDLLSLLISTSTYSRFCVRPVSLEAVILADTDVKRSMVDERQGIRGEGMKGSEGVTYCMPLRKRQIRLYTEERMWSVLASLTD